jgi:hypothetical protein
MTNKFISIMDKIGADIKVAWSDVVKYLPAAASLAALIFPAQAAAITGVVSSVDLIQQAVATVEQKFAAAGNPTGTGPEKLAQVISLVSPTVTQLLTAEGLNYNAAQVTNIVNAVVAVLNVQEAPVTPSASVAA